MFIVFLFFLVFFFSSISPNKLSISLILFSLFFSVAGYFFYFSLYPSCSILISFSSGMMILFTYCSMMSSYEVKSNKMSFFILFCLMVFFTLSFFDSFSGFFLESSSQINLLLGSSLIILFFMFFVVISMLCINMTMFDPQKGFLGSYY